MIADNELLDEVRAALRAEVADVTASPALLAGVRRRHARRRWTRIGVGLAAVTATAAVAAVVVVPNATPPRPAVENAAYVVERTDAALTDLRDDIAYERAESVEGDKYFAPGERGLNERWRTPDNRAFRYRAGVAGEPIVDLSFTVFVDYRARTYRRLSGDPWGEAVWTPDDLRRAIADGRVEVIGPGDPVDGKPTVKLHVNPLKADVPLDVWVDASTYVPLRWQWNQDHSTPFDVTWLPPTPENLAHLDPPIPPGFIEVD
ncbi:hypothetical protein ACIGNX_23190 [Actinosynnema sp. NPDC053489]|uniref:hypothetical protein n=1 Tax=Actinosynnema sp. NPDC053489 TaxID=3363916 RepID=UPI0037C5605C